MRKAIACLSLAMLAACTAASEPSSRSSSPPSPSPAASTQSMPTPGVAPPSTTASSPRVPAELIPASELIGEWRIAGIDGREIDAPYAITASIDGKRIHVVADCINLAWSYAAESGSITTKRVPVEGCARGLSAQEQALVAALDTATGFGRVPSNAIEIFSTGRRVTLYSQ